MNVHVYAHMTNNRSIVVNADVIVIMNTDLNVNTGTALHVHIRMHNPKHRWKNKRKHTT